MTQATLDNQAVAQIELSAYMQQQSQEAAHYEIDSVPDIFGNLYRVWGGSCGINLLGTFYQNLSGFWISQPSYSSKLQQWRTSNEAVTAIVNA
ncbi:hypothetical protein BZZ01_11440 [Nostocales cyanobacterium HT-58-2]|nr:hypothetical protein BZZ01_11440 [Nostocales cyanobacterium HT-58-2]